MKNILGLDLGTTSIGWAFVKEAETPEEKSSIVRIGVRVNPLTVDEQTNFNKGKPITTNADRTLKRSMRRNLQRYKLRRKHLVESLRAAGILKEDSILAEQGPGTTFETLRLRAKAAAEMISLEELARVLLMINKKRGYKSSRKAQNDDDGQLIDGMSVAKKLYENNLTPGQYSYEQLCSGKVNIPDFYRSDLVDEFYKVWDFQRQFYPDILTDSLKEELRGKNEKQTWAICRQPLGLQGVKRETKGAELRKENYKWRSDALTERLDLESLAVVLQKINSDINSSSGYLGSISDRSKELYFNGQTVGQYLAQQVCNDSHYSLKNKVFYRQDYLDEFERIWSVQSQYHSELTSELKKELRDIVIFYQRPLKSQKGLVSICELEGREVEVIADGKSRKKLIGPKVCPKSSPLFQEFKIWQIINNLTANGQPLSQESREKIFDRALTCDKLSKSEIIKCLVPKKMEKPQDSLFDVEEMYDPDMLMNIKSKKDEVELNYRELDGNRTFAALLKAYSKIIVLTGHEEYDFSKTPYSKAMGIISEIFSGLGYKTDFLHFDSNLDSPAFEEQSSFRLWHLLYSYEGDNSASGTGKLVEKIAELTGMEPEYAKIIAGVTFAPDYGSLSSKAMKKILPYMKAGNEYSLACTYAGYNHSKNSLTKEQIESKELKEHLDNLPKNSLRNPVVEKILNQMVNVVNAVIDEYGRPDEIRIELARELKKSAAEREQLTKAVADTDKLHKEIRDKISRDFPEIQNPSRNDVIRYKLYKELACNGYHTLYSDKYIPYEKLFSKEFDIEHIIPQSRLFDDSFSNKTLEDRQVNIDKGNLTAFDFVKERYGEEQLAKYQGRIDKLFKEGKISKAKRNKLLMPLADIPSDFIARDLRDSQYIAKKAKSMLEEIVRYVVPTTGSVTDRLREDWQLVDVMKELNWDKYDKLGLTYTVTDHDGRRISKIKDWTKRNDHRHHAMDALTIAFTKRSYIQYLNNLNARISKDVDREYIVDLADFGLYDIPKSERSNVVRCIERTQLYRDSKGRLRFIPPIPLDEFRREARKHLENTLVSIKAKNKVVTRNVNKTKCRGGSNRKVQLTPRGQLHNETVYGQIQRYATKLEKVGPTFNIEKISRVASPIYRAALENRLTEFGGDPKKAFSGKNGLDKAPVWLDAMHTRVLPEKVALLSMETMYTIRKPVSPELKLEKVVDDGIRRILQERLDLFCGDAKLAFSNLEENPIWLNREKGIQIKRVAIKGVNNAEPLHCKRDHNGNLILGHDGRRIPADYVNTGNNHHVAIYRDADGNLQEQVVSFYEAVARVGLGMPVIDREYRKDEGWEFLFTMKQNEYFVFPNAATGFDPREYDLMNPENYALISPNLFRVQTMSKVMYGNSVVRDYKFRHHLETTVNDNKKLNGITYKQYKTLSFANEIVKVRVNHIGQIVQVGEY